MSTDGSTVAAPRTIKASEFKARCLQLMDEVAETGEEIVITKYGPPGLEARALQGKAEAAFRSKQGQHSSPGRHRLPHACRVV